MGLKVQRPVEVSALLTAGAVRHPPLTADLRLRIVCKLMLAPRGSKAAVASQLAAECRVGVSTVHRWQKQFRAGGYPALLRRTRSEAGRPKIYSSAEWEALRGAAWRIQSGKMRAEFRALGIAGSYENFRWWIWRIRRHEVPDREAKSA